LEKIFVLISLPNRNQNKNGFLVRKVGSPNLFGDNPPTPFVKERLFGKSESPLSLTFPYLDFDIPPPFEDSFSLFGNEDVIPCEGRMWFCGF